MSLPIPAAGRFKPLRCGLVELFLYEAQEFPFRDGRLLLRGDNGSGKSKVLALTLPLLLDANLSPARMEPDADAGKRMAWNLLMGDEYEERTGYSWIEFGRIDEDGTARFVTLGLGVKAVRQKGVVRQWWFLTDQRVGEELHLVDRTRTVRTRERLVEAIGDRGAVFDTAERYRRAVDEALFGLHARYEALVDLLVQLRQPQLSKRPNEQLLGRALSEALAPVPDALIDTVAESYQALEDEERAVGRLRSSAAAVRAFTDEYAAYARVATRRATAAPRRAQSEYEDRNRQAREAERALEEARIRFEAADIAVTATRRELAELAGERDALLERRTSKDQHEFHSARELAAAAAETVRDSAQALESARGRLERAGEAREQSEVDDTSAAARLEDDRAELSALAGRAGIRIDPSAEPEELGRTAAAEQERRERHVAHLRDLVRDEAAAAARHTAAEKEVDAAESALEAADERMRGAEALAEEAARAWLDALRDHLGGATELRDDGLAEALEAAADWASLPEGEGPLDRWARTAQRRLDAEFGLAIAQADAELNRLAPLVEAVEEEIAELDAGGIIRPPAPHTRTADRARASGAAFWECVELASGTTAAVAAGVESALEAAGILDAWVGFDGSVTAVSGDTLLRVAPLDGPTLGDVLIPSAAAGVSTEIVEGLLRSVALVDEPTAGTIAVSADGAFALGPLVGSWSKPTADYLGAVARESARLARLDAARAELVRLFGERSRWDDVLAEMRDRRGRLQDEFDRIPVDEPVRRAAQEAVFEARRRADTEESLARSRSVLELAAAEWTMAQAARAAAASDYGLDPGALDDVSEALRELPRAVGQLSESLARRRRAAEQLVRAVEGEKGEAAETAEAEHKLAEAERKEATARQRFETLDATAGAEAREIEQLLTGVDDRISAVHARGKMHDEQRQDASNVVAVATDRLSGITEEVDRVTRAREAAAEVFRDFAGTGLLAVASPGTDIPDPGSTWAPDPTVRLARRVLDELGGQDADENLWDRAVERLRIAFEALQGELSTQGRQASWEQRHGVTVVAIQVGSEYVVPETLSADLEAELADRERLLTEKERAILETHLIDEVGAQLHERVREAMQQVDRMNAELAQRPTRSGLKLRILWEPGDDELDREGTKLLKQSAAAWSPADRDAIGEYLRTRISTARVEDPEGSWHERLTRAFDYRSWNRFSVQLHQNGVWRPASGPASGGERVLAASVPLFAAAASHYASAGNPQAPRLILLDEAFAGVDDRSRASYLGLLTEFDLDVVMTSEREWATYPEIPGIAIAHLFRLPGTQAVHVEHWTWDGVMRERVADPGMTAIEPSPPREWNDQEFALDFGEPA